MTELAVIYPAEVHHGVDGAVGDLSRVLVVESRLIETAPESCREQVERVNEGIHRRLAELTALRYGQPTPRQRSLVRIAAVEGPYGVVRPYLRDAVPEWLTDVAVASSKAILALGD